MGAAHLHAAGEAREGRRQPPPPPLPPAGRGGRARGLGGRADDRDRRPRGDHRRPAARGRDPLHRRDPRADPADARARGRRGAGLLRPAAPAGAPPPRRARPWGARGARQHRRGPPPRAAADPPPRGAAAGLAEPPRGRSLGLRGDAAAPRGAGAEPRRGGRRDPQRARRHLAAGDPGRSPEPGPARPLRPRGRGARPDDLLEGSPGGPSYPAIDRLYSESLVFDRAYAVAPWAISTLASSLTSVVPPAHKTINGTFVAESQTLLSEVVDRAGYATVAATADLDFSAARGLTQGFDEVVSLARGPSQRNDAPIVVSAGLRASAARSRPRMLYAVVADPQAPYEPPRELQGEAARPAEAPLPHLTHLWLGRVRAGKVAPTRAELAYVRRLYRGELQVVDRALGELLEALERDGGLDDAIVVLVGLHGEEFLEHGGAGHGFSLHEESLRVPLAIRAPKLLAPGRVRVPVDLLDLAPTLVDLLGLPFPVEWQGESLVGVIDDPQPPPRLVVAYMGDGSRAAIVGDAKLIVGSGRGLEAQRLYDLARDPGEREDLLARGGIALRIVRQALAWEIAEEGRWKRARWGSGADLRPAFALDHGM
ncbi:MAG: sulfatase-like hydrolase/transferase [Myxococcales bacterium]|nr:sulfatase-like hydrolase/transferase [Myxococcales bacterium]